jgi:hypothetical protein
MKNRFVVQLRASSFKLRALGCLFFLASCASPKPATQTAGKYQEDLTLLRPKIETATIIAEDTSVLAPTRKTLPYVDAKYAVNKQVDAVLDSIDKINLSRKFIDGYTILIYTGISKEEALIKKKELTGVHPALESELQYAQPNFRVKAGKFNTKLEAQRDFAIVKKFFPAAIIIPDKIPLN